MRWLSTSVGVAALLSVASAQDPDSKVVVDAQTGFTFGEYVTEQGISYRVAIPDPAPATGGYDAVVQIAAPISMGWVGMAWGGSMTYNPLTIVWKNGDDVVISSRFAYGYYVPPAYNQSTYTVLKTGTHINATHWQITAQCSGCTEWGDADIGVTSLDPTQQNPLAFAYSSVAPETPASNTSSFGIHDSVGHWYHDFAQGVNPGFSGLVSKNSEGTGPSSSAVAPISSSSGTVASTTPSVPEPTTAAPTTAAPTTTSDPMTAASTTTAAPIPTATSSSSSAAATSTGSSAVEPTDVCEA